jgi:hypothetical protein
MIQVSTSFTTGAATLYTPGTGSATVNLTGVTTSGDNLDSSVSLGGSDIVIGNISVAGLDHTFSPQQIVNIPYVLKVTISDYGSAFTPVGIPGTNFFTVTGRVTGTIGAGNRVNISTNTYGANPGAIFIGTDQFALDLTRPQNYVPPGPSLAGTFSAHISGQLNGNIPEPSTLTLAGFGLLSISIPAFRRWRRRTSR